MWDQGPTLTHSLNFHPFLRAPHLQSHWAVKAPAWTEGHTSIQNSSIACSSFWETPPLFVCLSLFPHPPYATFICNAQPLGLHLEEGLEWSAIASPSWKWKSILCMLITYYLLFVKSNHSEISTGRKSRTRLFLAHNRYSFLIYVQSYFSLCSINQWNIM